MAKKARVNLAGFGLISDSGLTLFVSGIMNWNIQKGNGVMSILSTREWATLIWECIFLLYVLYHKEIRKSFWNIVVRFFDKKLRILWEIIFLMITVIFSHFPLWENIYIKDIVILFVFSRLIYCMNAVTQIPLNFLRKSLGWLALREGW